MSGKTNPQKRRVGDGTPGPGRTKGVPNKFTGAIKEMVRQALDEAGGVAYLQKQATDNPTAFMTLVGKLLPLEVSGPDGGAITLEALVTKSIEAK
jgi:hypothetical protein